ncbi:MAG: DEAD/DEAH box helicase, partial [Candidatus Neomarinimicrobiota bacterium]
MKFFLYIQKKTTSRNFSYEKENDLDNVLSSSFSFVETPDQKKAFQDVFEDMNGETPMDRLVSGDVGFGKTEVAIRAIFKAFLSNKVSALLCPTTILADQHFITCRERLSQFGVSISLLSRFKTKKEQSETISLVKQGKIDVLIGTHRLLSKDVEISNLGLLVIDEEHRFGVTHKEKIRSFKNNVDVLTLTATPIPRTLQQALVGLKNLTTIKTPPISRKPINTYVKYFNWSLVFSHIQKEINRGGQVYFLYNDIKSIPFAVKKIKDRFPKKTVVGASGKMDSKNLENTVLGFFDGFIDVLVCTTIIESGLDVTNANTMIINNAQNFGLAQLYQIRGRVGRGKRQASCLLLIPPKKKLEKDSYNRLRAIEQNTALGSGHIISQKDLEIRGSGSLFGYKQSGHISVVGFEMYCDLLREEVNNKKNLKNKTDQPVLVMNTEIEIPTSYIKKEQIRIDYYYQISKTRKNKDLEKVVKNLEAGF